MNPPQGAMNCAPTKQPDAGAWIDPSSAARVRRRKYGKGGMGIQHPYDGLDSGSRPRCGLGRNDGRKEESLGRRHASALLMAGVRPQELDDRGLPDLPLR